MTVFLLLLLLSFLALVVTHVIPWRIVPPLVKRDGDLHRVAAYVIGVSVILAIFIGWTALDDDPDWEAVVALVTVVIGAGLGTVIPRIVKRIDAKFAAAREAEEAKAKAEEAKAKAEALQQRIDEIEQEADHERPDSRTG